MFRWTPEWDTIQHYTCFTMTVWRLVYSGGLQGRPSSSDMVPASSLPFMHIRDGGEPSLMACFSWSCRKRNTSRQHVWMYAFHLCWDQSTWIILVNLACYSRVKVFSRFCGHAKELNLINYIIKYRFTNKATKVCLSTHFSVYSVSLILQSRNPHKCGVWLTEIK